MDEPTTGMDPVNQKSVWDLIQKLKKDRIVILTTHNMEEAGKKKKKKKTNTKHKIQTKEIKRNKKK